MREPDGLTYAVLARTRRTRRMPRWADPERWLSMTVITRPALAPPVRMAWLLLIALLALALAAGGAIVGASLINPARPADRLSGAYPIPVGGAAVLAFDSIHRRPEWTDRPRHLHRPRGWLGHAPADQ